MYPHLINVLGVELSVWNFVFLVASVIGGMIWVTSIRRKAVSLTRRELIGRWALVVYLSAVAAQTFAYLVDLNTSLTPPEALGWVRYYLDPLHGPKTLYGSILLLPLTTLAVAWPRQHLRYSEALDRITPPVLAVLALCRVGCFLQGCCFGVRSKFFGVRFPASGPVYSSQLAHGLIPSGGPTLPVIPTQTVEAVALGGLCLWSLVRLRNGSGNVFAPAIAAYSVVRFGLEFVRDDPERNFFGPLSTSQWVALALIAAYVVWMALGRSDSVKHAVVGAAKA